VLKERFRNSRSPDIQPLKQTLNELESIYVQQQLHTVFMERYQFHNFL